MPPDQDARMSMSPADRRLVLLWLGAAALVGLAANIWAIARVAM